MLLAQQRTPKRRAPSLRGLGAGEALPPELDGALIVGTPGVDPIPPADQAIVPEILEEAKAADAEIAQLEAALATPDETPAEEAALRARLAELQALAERIQALTLEAAPPAPLPLQAEVADKKALLNELRSMFKGLGSETVYPAAIPYIDMADPASPGWKILGDPGRTGDIRAGRQGVQFLDEPGWVLAAAGNAQGDAGRAPLRPIHSSLFSCPTSGTWGAAQKNGQHARERLIADGMVRECDALFAAPPRVASNGMVYAPPGGQWGATTCAPGPRYSGRPWVDPNSLRMQGSAFTFLQPGMRYLQPTATTDFSTQKWLEAGAPEDFWVCVHDVQTGLPHALREVTRSVTAILQNPYFSAAMILLMPMAGLTLAALMASAPAGVVLPTFGASAASAALTQVVRVKVISDLATGNTENMSRTWARSIAAGFLIPGYGPILAVIAPRQTNAFLQTAAANLFFTVPGFTSLVVYAETRKKKRDELREELTRKQGAFYVKYRIGMIVRVVGAVVAIVASVLSLGALAPEMALLLSLLNMAVSLWDALYQAEMTINSLTIIERQLKEAIRNAQAIDVSAVVDAQREGLALLAELDAEIARLCGGYHGTDPKILTYCGKSGAPVGGNKPPPGAAGPVGEIVTSIGGFGLAALVLAGILLMRRD